MLSEVITTMLESKKLAIFLDHANIWHILQKYNLRIDYKRLKEIIGEKFNYIDAIAYLGFPEWQATKKTLFLKSLARAGWYFVFKALVTILNGEIVEQSVVQVMLTHITEIADSYEKLVIISDNGRIVQLIKTLQKEVEVWSFRECISKEIIRSVGSEHIKYLDHLLIDGNSIIKL